MPHPWKRGLAEVLKLLYCAATSMEPGVKFAEIWMPDNLQKSFDKAKQLLIKAVQLTHLDPQAPIALTT